MGGSFKPCGVFTGLEDADLEHQLNVMPNPNNGRFDLELLLSDTKDLRIEIYNSVGQMIQSFDTLIEGRRSIDLTKHASGIYYVNVSLAGAKVTRKVIVE